MGEMWCTQGWTMLHSIYLTSFVSKVFVDCNIVLTTTSLAHSGRDKYKKKGLWGHHGDSFWIELCIFSRSPQALLSSIEKESWLGFLHRSCSVLRTGLEQLQRTSAENNKYADISWILVLSHPCQSSSLFQMFHICVAQTTGTLSQLCSNSLCVCSLLHYHIPAIFTSLQATRTRIQTETGCTEARVRRGNSQASGCHQRLIVCVKV